MSSNVEQKSWLVERAKQRFKDLDWPGDCPLQKRACDNAIELLEVFDKQGHT